MRWQRKNQLHGAGKMGRFRHLILTDKGGLLLLLDFYVLKNLMKKFFHNLQELLMDIHGSHPPTKVKPGKTLFIIHPPSSSLQGDSYDQ